MAPLTDSNLFRRSWVGLACLLFVATCASAGVIDPNHRLERVGAAVNDGVFVTSMPGVGRLLVGERGGDLKLVAGDGLVTETIATIPVSQTCAGEGLMGGVWMPSTPYLYLSWIQPSPRRLAIGRILFDNANQPGELETLRDFAVGATCDHLGGAIEFASDFRLLIATGDMGQPSSAGNITSTNGKILRMNGDGSLPPDNVLPGSAVYGMGVRDPGGFARDSVLPNVFFVDRGPGMNDELNHVERQANYGWPTGTGALETAGFTDPVQTWATPIGSSTVALYRADHFNGWQGDALVAGDDGSIDRVDLNGAAFVADQPLVTPGTGMPTGWRSMHVQDGYVWMLDGQGDLWRFRSSKGTPLEPSRDISPVPMTVTKDDTGRIVFSVERQPGVTQYGLYVGEVEPLVQTATYNHGVTVGTDLLANQYVPAPADDGSAYAKLTVDDTFPPAPYFLLSADSTRLETGCGYSSAADLRPGGGITHGCPCPDGVPDGVRPGQCATPFTIQRGWWAEVGEIGPVTFDEEWDCDVIVLDLSEDWCFWCHELAPELEQMYVDYRDRGFTALTLLSQDTSGNDATWTTVQGWVSRHGSTNPVLLDQRQAAMNQYFNVPDCNGWPQSLIFGADGVQTDIVCGYSPDAIRAAIERNLAAAGR